MSTTHKRIQLVAEFSAAVLQAGKRSDLTWDEAVAALGLASKTLATEAAAAGDGTSANCEAWALKRFDEGFTRNVGLVSAAQASASH